MFNTPFPMIFHVGHPYSKDDIDDAFSSLVEEPNGNLVGKRKRDGGIETVQFRPDDGMYRVYGLGWYPSK